jgi:ATP-dependent DNA ligase
VVGLRPPVALTLARDESVVPAPNPRWVYEPKMDGWRAALFTRAGFVQSRRDNNLATRFPEIAAAGRGLGDVVLDGELVALHDGRLDFGALTSNPASRADLGITIYYIAFDLLSEGKRDWRPEPLHGRRERLEELFSGVAPPLQLMPNTTDRDEALRWLDPANVHVGIEGVVVKTADQPYRPGRTGDWLKVRHTVVVDAVVVGVTGVPQWPAELVLARPDETGELRQIGLSLPLPPRFRDQAGQHITPTGEPPVRLSSGVFGRGRTEYHPVHPTLIVEAQTEASVETFSSRLRPHVHRLRPDLTIDDLDQR